MINLLQAVINRLDGLFPDVNIYIKNVEQGLIEPCFFVHLINTNVVTQFAKRYKVDSLISIMYLNQSADPFVKQTVEQKLIYSMKNINLDSGGVYGFLPEVKYSEGDLVFTINYRYFTNEIIPVDPYMMENKIIHYTNEEPYDDATERINPGMWESSPWPERHIVYPKIHTLDPRYKKDEKMWEVDNALMGRKEHEINDKN